MDRVVPRPRQILMTGALAIAAAILPRCASAAESAPLLIASQTTINQDMQQDAQESPSNAPPDPAAAAAAQDPAFAERRAKMIKHCEDNNGVDCEQQVDVELGAQMLQQEGGVRTHPPAGRRD